jgi:hypothetical protein
MTLGIAAVGAGVTLYAIDEDKDPNQHFYRDTAPVGVALAAGGAIALGSGMLWFRAAGKRSAPVAAVTHDTAYIGWIGRF